jgi:glycosyltransferase involved in cell wall biosynthesis
MRILYHHRTLSKDGQNVHIEELIDSFRRLGHEVCVVGPMGHKDADFGSSGGLMGRLRRTLPPGLSELAELFYSAIALGQLWRAYRRFRPDALYERYNLFLLSGAWLRRLTGIPFVVEVNAPLAYERNMTSNLSLKSLARRCERYVWRSADILLPVTGVLSQYLREAGIEQKRIRIVMNGINPDLFPADLAGDRIRRRYGLQDKVVIGFTGFLRSWHGLPAVLDVMHDLIGMYDIHLLVVGDGPAKAELMQRARARGLESRVTVTGVVERSEIPAYVAAFDVALQPKATGYSSPLKLFEYMALARAIVAPNQPNLREVLNDGINALLFMPDNLDSFRTTLKRLISDRALRRQLGDAAQETIYARDLTWSGNARRVVNALHELDAAPA